MSNLPLSLKCSVLEDVASGLLYLHERQPPVIHRDLTSKNVLLTSSLVAKILSPTQRKIESNLLKERWDLIQKGCRKENIKIRNNRLLVNNKVAGTVTDGSYVATRESQSPPTSPSSPSHESPTTASGTTPATANQTNQS